MEQNRGSTIEQRKDFQSSRNVDLTEAGWEELTKYKNI